MIANDQELQTTLDRIAWFQNQVAQLRKAETNPGNDLPFRVAVEGRSRKRSAAFESSSCASPFGACSQHSSVDHNCATHL